MLICTAEELLAVHTPFIGTSNAQALFNGTTLSLAECNDTLAVLFSQIKWV